MNEVVQRIDPTALHEDAYALQFMRVIKGKDEGRYYTPLYFPESPRSRLAGFLNRLRLFNGGEDYATLDILDEEGDIIQDFVVSRDGFKYAQRTLKFRVEEGA